jgi:hypothetical protein
MNQPPPTENQTGKRIVSKGAYVKAQSKRIGMFLLSSTPILITFSILYAGFRFVHYQQHIHLGWFALLIVIALYAAGGLIIFAMMSEGVKQGAILFEEARRFDPGIPSHRANTADLPAPDSLVRASAEPAQEPQVLLRAATQEPETPPEELVRPSQPST